MSEPLQCSICRDGFSSPVVLPCGHCFCLGCIGEYWRVHRPYQCPLCRAIFPQPATQLKLHQKEGESKEAAVPLKAGEVSCDVYLNRGRSGRASSAWLLTVAHIWSRITGTKSSEATTRSTWLKNLEGSICGLHGKQLDRFCRSDQMCICVMCAQTDHRGHNIVSITKEDAKKRVMFHKHFSNNMT